jgi:hypothetical protein
MSKSETSLFYMLISVLLLACQHVKGKFKLKAKIINDRSREK